MEKLKCRRCGKALRVNAKNPREPNVANIGDQGLITRENRKLYELNAGRWCSKCRKDFLREMKDLDAKYWECIEAQDGKLHESNWYIYMVRTGQIRRHRRDTSFGSPISGHKPQTHYRRSNAS